MRREANEPFTSAVDFFRAGGEMGRRIREFDWARSRLRPLDRWQNSLKTAVRIILDSKYPMFLWWGSELINLYNDAYIPILGERHPEALGRPAPEIWSELWGTLGLQAEAVMASGESSWNEQALLIMERHGYREETYFTFSYSPAPDDDGGIGGVFCACTEETDRVLGERRLLTLRQVAASSVAATSGEEACKLAAAVLEDRPHDIAFALFYLLGKNQEEARLIASAGVPQGAPYAPATISLLDDESVWPLQEALSGGAHCVLRGQERRNLPGGAWSQPANTAVVLPLVEGQRQPTGVLIVGASPLRPFDDGYQGFFDLLASGVASSITKARAFEEARKQAQALEEIDRAKTVFFSNVAHELRTPLTLILGPLEEAIASELIVNPELRSDLEVAHRNGLRLLRLINSMLDFSRIEAGRMQAVYEPTDLASLTRELTSVFRSAIDKAGLAFTVDCPPLDQPVWVDRDMWEKIVLNLLSNAFKFTLSGGIRVVLAIEGDGVELTVNDTGGGIPPEELPHLFERFHRVAGAEGRTQEGSGIGLALVQELVKLHGGSISVVSRKGEGSTFRVRLPLGSEHLSSGQVVPNRNQATTAISADAFLQEALRWLPSKAAATASPTTTSDESLAVQGSRDRRGGRIVLADDNADMREYVRHILGRQFQVEAVADGQEALEAVQRQIPDLVLSDVMMPRLDGFELLKRLRSDPATSSIPIVLLTARAGEDSLVEGMEAGADDYLMKPFSARELVARVAGHLEIARLRREAAERLRESQEQLARHVYDFDVLMRELPVGIAVSTDADCRNIRVNNMFAKMLGISDRQNASKSGPDEADLPFRIMRDGIELRPDQLPMQIAAREAREVRDFEADILRQDGTVVHELCHAVPLFDAAGSVRGSLAVFVDITERRHAEEALRESEQRFRNMAESAPVMIWVTDPDGSCVYINRQWREFTGTTLDQNLGLGWTESVHEDDRTKARDKFLEATHTRQPFHAEYRLRRRDGQWRWAVDSATPRFAEDGSFLGYIGSVIDITERKEMESALRTSEEQLALAQAAAGVGSWNWNPQTKSSAFSGEYFALHGLPRDHSSLTYEEWLAILHPEDRERVHEAMQTALRETRSLDTEFRVVHPDGSTRWLAGKGTVFCDAAGQPVRFTGVNYDVTQRKLAEDELLRSNEDLKQFAFAASHDLQEPLRVVINYTQLLERRYKDQLDEPAGKIIDTAVGSALRMERLLRGLRDYWQISDLQSIQIAIVDLGDVLQKALMNLQDAVQQSGATVTHGKLPLVNAAETPMIQVFQNLLGNAMKYRSPDRALKIEVSCETRASEYVISVSDNGIGIQPQYANQVFGIFKRLHGQEYAGAGIGLSICQKIIERLGGKIWVEPREHGSTFRFSIPMGRVRAGA